ncbi:uncharacterized protein N7500_007982 [Penicillium coprophilum]|uniref:uncharacterized protein n=1 Tax=Penicillium coprophilum TaxID=36646 RepID=UPI00238C58B1|nr:uncharacterized protein N7500_007982 [Penicillium coprophilum]KAJ5158331.1 hypothetical protein N7500_007982 [Penicillium coprophilum]
MEFDPFELEEAMKQLKKEYPNPRLNQVELNAHYEDAEMSGNRQRIGHYHGLLRANKREIGALWNKPDDFRKVFELMAEDMRQTRDEALYAHPAPARDTGTESQSGSRPESQRKPLDIAEGVRMLKRRAG